MRNFRRIVWALCLAVSQFALCAMPMQAQQASHPAAISPAAVSPAPLNVEQIVKNLDEKNRERTSALQEFQGTRIYRMQYRGFPGDRDAEMVVNVTYHSPNTKEFTVVSSTGNKFLVDHVFNKLLQGEQEAASDENRRRTALDSSNYNFTLAGTE